MPSARTKRSKPGAAASPTERVTDLRDLHKRRLLLSAKEVLALIRERVCTGQLPSGSPDKTYGTKGSNSACACCGRKIGSHEVEYEVHFRSFPQALSTHLSCYQIWWEEWRADRACKAKKPQSVSANDVAT